MTIEPDGKWEVQAPQVNARPGTTGSDIFGDDDLITITDEKIVYGGQQLSTPARSLHSSGTPTMAMSREGSIMPRSSSAKRPLPEVISISSDEDEEPPSRPAKRPHVGSSKGSFMDSRMPSYS